MSKIMQPAELRDHIKSFLRERSNASLATCSEGISRSSPVQYFLGQDLDIFILSAGGDKFKNLNKNPNVCLLVSTDYVNYTRIKGVQVFGQAITSEQDDKVLTEAELYCPDFHLFSHMKDYIKAIKIVPDHIVYLGSLEDGDRTKQILRGDHIVVKTDKSLMKKEADRVLEPSIN